MTGAIYELAAGINASWPSAAISRSQIATGLITPDDTATEPSRRTSARPQRSAVTVRVREDMAVRRDAAYVADAALTAFKSLPGRRGPRHLGSQCGEAIIALACQYLRNAVEAARAKKIGQSHTVELTTFGLTVGRERLIAIRLRPGAMRSMAWR